MAETLGQNLDRKELKELSNRDIADLFNSGQKVTYYEGGVMKVANNFAELAKQAEEDRENKN